MLLNCSLFIWFLALTTHSGSRIPTPAGIAHAAFLGTDACSDRWTRTFGSILKIVSNRRAERADL
jgi:hypothetical protein